MRIAWKFFWQSVRITLSSWSFWILFIASLILGALFIIIVPVVQDNWNAQDVWMIEMMSTMVTVCTISFFCSAIGEAVANANERIFILSRPIARSIYLTIKIVLTIIIVSIVAAIMSLFYFGLYKAAIIHNSNVFYNGITLGRMIGCMFILCIFGGVVGVCFRYYIKEMISSVVILLVFMIYGILFIFLKQEADSQKATNLNMLEFYILPLTLFLPLTLIASGLGYFLNAKVNIGS